MYGTPVFYFQFVINSAGFRKKKYCLIWLFVPVRLEILLLLFFSLLVRIFFSTSDFPTEAILFFLSMKLSLSSCVI